jgi:hypothetical protein
MIDFNIKQAFLVILFLGFTSFVIGQRWHSYSGSDPKYGNMYFANQLSESFFKWVEYGESLTSQNYIVNEGFLRTFEDPPNNSTYPGHLTTGVKFQVRLSKAKEKMFSKAIDTIVTNQAFYKVKNFDDYSESERTKLLQIDTCYLINYSYRKAKYLFHLNDEIYYLKITKKLNHPFIVRKLYAKNQLPARYLYIFFKQVYLDSKKPSDDYSYSMWFEGKDFSNRKGVVKTELIND